MTVSIAEAKEVMQRFPDGTTSNYVCIVFEDEAGGKATRTVKVSSCAKKVTKNLKLEVAYQFGKAAHEAARELGQEFKNVRFDDQKAVEAMRLAMEGAIK